jgi:5,10-methylene-tetrahydrofolate dehydrogenase/methenyl tetrahydrofolate cyclohydrolase
MRLNVYYDNPNKASDMYLKYLKKDCEDNNIEVVTFDNIDDWTANDCGRAELILEPTKASFVPNYVRYNVDRPSATAQGIYNYITENHPQRDKVVLVIGRGLVGKALIDMLMDYGYTVIETNSKTKLIDLSMFALYADIIVGVSSKDNIFDKEWCERLITLHKVLIDASNNFDTKDKLRCGKWTRKIIIDRIKEREEETNE